MCRASKYLSDMEKMLRDVEEDFKKLSTKQSEYDQSISDMYHKIETMNFNACEGYYLAKRLQDALRERRVVKDEFSKINTLRQMLPMSNINNCVHKAKKSIGKYKDKEIAYRQNWKDGFSIEEILH